MRQRVLMNLAFTGILATTLAGPRQAIAQPVHQALAVGTILFDRCSSSAKTDCQIYTIGSDGSGLTKLTSKGSNMEGAWSPDGTKIAFASNRNGNWEIYEMGANGSAQKRLTNNKKTDAFPTWAIDGVNLAIASKRSGRMEIWRLNTSSRKLSQLTNLSGANTAPSWSPDGSEIAYATSSGVGGEALVVLAWNDQVTAFLDLAPTASRPAWSPDATTLAYASASAGNSDIWSWTAPGYAASATNLTAADTSNESEPTFSPDGARLAFVTDRADANGDIWLMGANGTGGSQLTTGPSLDEWPSWKPVACTGAWKVQYSPNPGGLAGNGVNDIWAASPSDAWAVGPRELPRPMLLHYNGSKWASVKTPKLPGAGELMGVSGSTAKSVWAVGFYFGSHGYEHNLAIHYNGRTWKVYPVPNVGAKRDNTLFEVSVGPGGVWARGISSPITTGASIYTIFRYSGGRWVRSSAPMLPGVTEQTYLDIASVSPTDVFVAARGGIARWDGSAWSTSSTTSASAVNGTSATDALAVGTDSFTSTIQAYNGASWSGVSFAGAINDVAGDVAHEAWAVGSDDLGRSLIEHWNGASWSQDSAPTGNFMLQGYTYFAAVAASGGQAWAVGASATGPAVGRLRSGLSATVIEHYC